jgi:hypothetical protein
MLGLSWFSIAVTGPSMLLDRKARPRKAGIPFLSSAQGMEIGDPWSNTVRVTRGQTKP